MQVLHLPGKLKAELCINGRNGNSSQNREQHSMESPEHLPSQSECPTNVTVNEAICLHKYVELLCVT